MADGETLQIRLSLECGLQLGHPGGGLSAVLLNRSICPMLL